MAFFIGILNVLLVVCSLFLICLVLIQRGKGGGLAGAFGGVGGSSAFGTKAGDVFTRITIGAAIIWIFLSMLLVVLNNRPRESAFKPAAATSPNEVPVTSGSTAGGSESKAAANPGPGPANPPPTTPPPASAGSTAPAPATNPNLPPAIPGETP